MSAACRFLRKPPAADATCALGRRSALKRADEGREHTIDAKMPAPVGPDSNGAGRDDRSGAHSVFESRRRQSRRRPDLDRKSTRLNSSHGYISYAVFCLKKKKKTNTRYTCRTPTR